MPHFINDAGTWKESTVYVNDAGTWKEPASIQVNDAGAWKEVYPSAPSGTLDSFESWPNGTGRNDLPDGWTLEVSEANLPAAAGIFQTTETTSLGTYAAEFRLDGYHSLKMSKSFDLTGISTIYVDVTFMVEHRTNREARAILYQFNVGSDTAISTYPATLQLDVSSLTGSQEILLDTALYGASGNLYDGSYDYSIVRFDNLRSD